MIFTAIILLVVGLFSTFIALLPTIAFPPELLTGYTNLFNLFFTLDRYLPIAEFFLCVGIYFSLFILSHTYYAVSRTYKEVKSYIPFL